MTVGEPENALKHRKALLSEEELLVTKERQSPQSLNQSLSSLGGCVCLALNVNIVEIPNLKEVVRGLQAKHQLLSTFEELVKPEELLHNECSRCFLQQFLLQYCIALASFTGHSQILPRSQEKYPQFFSTAAT